MISKMSKRIIFFVSFAGFLSVGAVMLFGRPYMAGDFTYLCKKSWGMLDGVSCKAQVKGPYWLWVQETGRIVLMYDKAGAGIADNASVALVGFDDRYVFAKLENETWYIFDHGDSSKRNELTNLKTHWVPPEGPLTQKEILERIDVLPIMLSTIDR